jgi:hypothetical protein
LFWQSLGVRIEQTPGKEEFIKTTIAPKKMNRLAMTSLITGILSVVMISLCFSLFLLYARAKVDGLANCGTESNLLLYT